MGISFLKLREYLRQKEITLKALEIMSKVNHDTLSNIYKDEYISLKSLEKIGRALGLKIGDIVDYKD
jgi:DNA-binding Xre family transcriptional regulator